MKRISLLLFMAILSTAPLSAQTSFWEEDFSTGVGWSVEPNWSITANMLEFHWSPSIQNFDASAISPVITLPENAAEMLVTQYLDVFSTSSNEMAEISIIHEDGEDVLWSYAISGGSWGITSGTEIEFSINPYEGQDVQLRFRSYGLDTYNWNWWNIFHIEMTVYLENDLAVSEITGPSQLELFETGSWDVVIKNTGVNPLANYTVNLYNLKTGEIIGSVDDPTYISPLATKSYSFEWSSQAAYNTAFYGEVAVDGDEFEGNNFSKGHFVRINPEIDFNIFVWDNDNAIETMVCPVQGDLIQPSTGLMRVLDEAGYSYDSDYYLPANLNTYDIVFATMGCYCLS